MITAWRLVKTRYADGAFVGEGARLHGGRWSSPGIRVAYASESVALAMLEVLVHLQASSVLGSYSLVSVSFPVRLVEELAPAALPSYWKRFPAPPEVQAIGDRWVSQRRSAVLRVPSVIVPTAGNFLLNPAHPDFSRVAIHPRCRTNSIPGWVGPESPTTGQPFPRSVP